MYSIYRNLVLLGADFSLGRVPKESLSQMTLMELFIEGIDNKDVILEKNDDTMEVSDWPGIKQNSTGETEGIYWSQKGLQGSIRLEWLPSSVQKVQLQYNYLQGSIDLISLPENLHTLDVENNALSGSICLECLPKSMSRLLLSKNNFSGTVALGNLPETLSLLYLHTNGLTGTLDLTNLPKELQSLSIHTNKFEGEADFSCLPTKLRYLNVSDNENLSGSLSFDSKNIDTKGTSVQRVSSGGEKREVNRHKKFLV